MQTGSENRFWKMRRNWRNPAKLGGFTYLALLATIVIMGIVLSAAAEVWHIALKREKERELLFIGNQFRHAIDSYYKQTPNQGRRHLGRLEDLLQDPRYLSTQRYLRRIYADPITGSTEWGVVRGAAGEILGVHSLSEEQPMKKGNFSLADESFEGKTKYADWIFMQTNGQPSAKPLQKP
jgi:type II secretory pathway pseudopilin PulG